MVAAGGWAGVETGWRLDRVFPAPVFCGGRRQPDAVVAFAEWFEARSWPVWDLTRLVSSNSCARLTLRTAGAKISCSAAAARGIPSEYVGVEILNRALRDDFIKTKNKIVLVPPCMAALPDDRCRAALTRLGNAAPLHAGCRVHQLTRLGKSGVFPCLPCRRPAGLLRDARRKAGSRR